MLVLTLFVLRIVVMSATLEINLFADYFQVILPALFLEDKIHACMHTYISIHVTIRACF